MRDDLAAVLVLHANINADSKFLAKLVLNRFDMRRPSRVRFCLSNAVIASFLASDDRLDCTHRVSAGNDLLALCDLFLTIIQALEHLGVSQRDLAKPDRFLNFGGQVKQIYQV